MRTKGKVKGLAAVFDGLKRFSSVQIDLDADAEEVQKYLDTEVKIEITKWSDKRSLNANAYYWKMVGDLALMMSLTNDEVHNLMLREYGTIETYDGSPVVVEIPDTAKAEDETLRSDTVHLKPTAETRQCADGSFRVYMLLKGSSRYNRTEMARLINGTISECNALGIETITPDEKERMLAAWNQ